MAYKWAGVKPIVDETGPIPMRRLSLTQSIPKNSTRSDKHDSVMVNNRFSRVNYANDSGPWGGPSTTAWNNPPVGQRDETEDDNSSPHSGRTRRPTIQFGDDRV